MYTLKIKLKEMLSGLQNQIQYKYKKGRNPEKIKKCLKEVTPIRPWNPLVPTLKYQPGSISLGLWGTIDWKPGREQPPAP